MSDVLLSIQEVILSLTEKILSSPTSLFQKALPTYVSQYNCPRALHTEKLLQNKPQMETRI
jgi:hypothetical protein